MPTATAAASFQQLLLFPGALEPCRNPKCRDVETRDRKRGLCRKCYSNKKIRDNYKPKKPSGFGAFKDSLEGAEEFLPDKPTTSLPGTYERIRILRIRAWRREALHHPDDYCEHSKPERTCADCIERRQRTLVLLNQRADGAHKVAAMG